MYTILFETNIAFIIFLKVLVDDYNGTTGIKGKCKYMSSGTMSALTTSNMNIFKSWCPSAWANGKVENHIKPYLDKPGYFGADCNNILKSIFWGLDLSKMGEIDKYAPNGPGVKRNSNGLKDLDANGLFNICTNISSDMNNILPGELVWMKGHIGVYYGKINGVDYVIDVTISQGGLALNKMSNQRWTKHGHCPFIGKYIEEEVVVDNNFIDYFNSKVEIKFGDNGDDVKNLQIGLNNANAILDLGFDDLVIDSKYGPKTDAIVNRLKVLYKITEPNVGIVFLNLLINI